jgi:hopanoid biosynthesis associated RND transporter like protein HpnN
MGILQRRVIRGVLTVVAHPKLTLCVSAVLLATCVAWAHLRLDISTDTNKLFSPKVKFFADYLAFDKKFPENEAVYVVIESKERASVPPVSRWTELADAIAARVGKLEKHVRSVDARVPIERLGDQGLLFESPDKLAANVEGARRFVPLVKLWGESPTLLTRVLGPTPMDRFLSGLLTQTPDAETARFVALLAKSWTRTLDSTSSIDLPNLALLDAKSPTSLGYYFVTDQTDPSNHLLLVRIYPKRHFDSLTAISETVQAIRDEVRAVATDFPEFTVGITGRPALEADEMSTTDRDSHRAEIVALSVIFVGLVLFLRSIWLAVVAEISLGFGIGWTFGWAELAVGQLNLLSIVFLIALIGIGMDYLVQILVRYRQEAARYESPRAIWTRVFRHVGPPINTACLGAAGAFLVATFTDFRGAAELGIIAGGGLLLCLLAGYSVLPALLTIYPAKRNAAHATASVSPAPADSLRLAMPAIWILALIAGVAIFAPHTGFNPNLIELQAPKLESVQLVRKLQTFSAVVLSKDLDVLRKVRDAVQHQPSVASTESLVQAYDNSGWLAANANLPAMQWAAPTPIKAGDMARLAEKANALAKRFDAGTDPAMKDAVRALHIFAERAKNADAARLSVWQTDFVKLLQTTLRQFNPGPPRVSELPVELRSHFIAEDGTAALYIYPKEDLWNRDSLGRFVQDVESVTKSVPGSPEPTGIAFNIHYTTQSIEQSFYKSAAYALVLIILLVLIDLRNIAQTFIAISVLGLGLPMLVSIMGLLKVDWNFANFFGLPILIGAGHEYGVFMVHRYREALRDPRRYWRKWDASDKALLLCAFVTCSSFGFFWLLANHRGLKSLGLVMTLGTACIYLATLLVVRPLLLWHLKRAHKARGPLKA